MTPFLKPIAPVLALLLILLSAGCSNEKKADKLLKRGENYYASGDYASARLIFLNVLDLKPESGIALTRLGSIWMKRGSPVQALPYLLAAKNYSRENLDSRTELAGALHAIGHRSKALEEISTILDKNPRQEDAIRFLSQLATSPSELEEAQLRIEKIKESSPSSYHLSLATLALRKNDAKVGEAELQKALAADPKSHLAQIGWARVLASQEKHEEALVHFKEARQHIPRYSNARAAYPAYLLKRGEIEAARKALETINHDAPGFLPIQHLLAQTYAHEKSYEEALALITRILDLDPTYLETLILRGRILRLTDKNKEALAHLQSAVAIELYTNSPNLHFEIAQTHLALKDLSNAISSLKKATSSPNAAPVYRVQLASLLLKEGNASAAQAEIKDFLSFQPNNSKALILLAETHRVLAQLDEAVVILRDLVDQDETDLNSRLRLASTLREQNLLAAARDHFGKALQLSPNNRYIITQLIELDTQEGKFAEAHAKADQLLAANPPLPQAHYLKARIFHAEKNWAAAVQSLSALDSTVKTTAETTILLISCYLELDESALALQELEELLPKIQNTPRALLAAALYFEELREYTWARQAHERVLELAPDSPVSLNNLAMLYCDHLQELDKALTLAQRARSLRPLDSGITDTLGWIHYHQGHYAQALIAFQKAAPDLTENLDAQLHLALAAYMMARSDLAVPALTRISKETPDAPSHPKRLLALLEDLQSPRPRHSAKELSAFLEDAPNDVIALLLLARIQTTAGDVRIAEKTLLRALGINDEIALVHTALAALYLDKLNAPVQALDHARTAREMDATDPVTAQLLGRISLREKDYQQAYTFLLECRGNLPPTAALAYDLSWATYSAGKPKDAVEFMTEALTLEPSDTIKLSAEHFLAMVRDTNSPDELAKARPLMEAILSEDSEHLPALFARARLARQENKLKTAEDALRSILKTAPDFLPAIKELAAVLTEAPNHLVEARTLAVKARDHDPEDLHSARLLARISFLQKRYFYAIQLYEQSMDDEPLDARAQYALGMSYHETGDQAKAAPTLKRALALGISEADTRTALEALKESE